MRKAVVTGGAGFIGSHLVDQLIDKGVEVIILDDLSTGKKENINPKAKFIKYDISNIPQSLLVDYIIGADTIFHLAAKTTVQESIKNPILYNDVNVKGTLNLLKAATTIKVKRFIFSSSSSVYGNAFTPTPEEYKTKPISPYALNKLIGEQYCKLYSDIYNLDTVCLRYFNVYGDRMNNEGGYKLVFPIFKEQLLNNKPLTINNDGEQRRDFIYVDDIVRANILVAKHKNNFNGDIFNVGSGESYSINEIADMFGGEKQYGNTTVEPFETLADISKIYLYLDFQPKNKLKTWISTFTEQSSTE
jgi:UDP-glucose 4-epimerase